jgi:hypothetical protein
VFPAAVTSHSPIQKSKARNSEEEQGATAVGGVDVGGVVAWEKAGDGNISIITAKAAAKWFRVKELAHAAGRIVPKPWRNNNIIHPPIRNTRHNSGTV